MMETNLTLEWVKIAQGLLATLIGGGLVLLAGWLSDRRKYREEEELRGQRVDALLTGMFAVRNLIVESIDEFAQSPVIENLEPLRTAQSYIHRLIDKATGESESLMIAVLGVGIHVDALLAIIDRHNSNIFAADQKYAELLARQIERTAASIDRFDIITHTHLNILSTEEIDEMFPGVGGDVSRASPNNQNEHQPN